VLSLFLSMMFVTRPTAANAHTRNTVPDGHVETDLDLDDSLVPPWASRELLSDVVMVLQRKLYVALVIAYLCDALTPSTPLVDGGAGAERRGIG
jgi:hypothetical protein